jgi:hypothetical protein
MTDVLNTDTTELPDTPDVIFIDDLEEIDTGTVADEEIKTIATPSTDPLIEQISEEFIEDALDETEVVLLANRFDPVDTVTMDSDPLQPAKTSPRMQKSLAAMMLGVAELDELALLHNIDFDDTKQDETLDAASMRLKTVIGTLADTLQTKYFANIATREGSDWNQGLVHGDRLIRAGKAKLRDNADPVMRIRNEMNLGGLIQIPLWHSGYWITLKTPSDSALLELEQRMSMEKVTLGRQSNGLIFSSAEVYTKSHLIDFIFDHVYSVTLDSKDPALLRSITLDSDYTQLVWGMAVACYPAGYPLLQPCIANPNKCEHVVEALINLSRISWLDQSRLSTAQRAHMLNRTNPSSLTKIKEYQTEFSAMMHSEISIHDNVALRLRVPTLEESRTIGYSWVESILTTTQKAFGSRIADGAREQYINNQALMTSLRQYGHWCDAVIRNGGGDAEEVIDDRAAVDEIITMISSDEAVVRKVYKAVTTFIDKSTISMIALPKYACPKCQKEPDAKYLRHPKLIPLDVVQVFFTLRDQKVTNKLVSEMTRTM